MRAAQGPTLGGPKGSVTGAELEVVRKLLDQEVYMQPQLEQLLGLSLDHMFAGNASQLRCVGVAQDFGACTHAAPRIPLIQVIHGLARRMLVCSAC